MLTVPVSSLLSNVDSLPIVVYLVNLVVASLLASGLALGALRFLRRAPLPLQHAILLCGLATTVVSPLVVATMQLTRSSLIAVAADAKIAEVIVPAGPPTTADRPLLVTNVDKQISSAAQPVNSAVDSGATQVESRLPTAETAPNGDIARARTEPVPLPKLMWVAIVVVIVWLAGSCYELWRLLAGIRHVRRLLATARPVVDPRLKALACSAARSLGMAAHPPLLESPAIESPVAVGVMRAKIVLPCGGGCDWSEDQWRFLIVHELAHVRRRDLPVGLVQRLALLVYWWNPLVKRTSQAISAIREQICDDLVATHTEGCGGYAALIVELAARIVGTPATVPALGVADGSKHELTQRVLRILDPTRSLVTRLTTRTRAWGSLFALLLVLCVASTSVHLAGAQAAEEKSPADKESPKQTAPDKVSGGKAAEDKQAPSAAAAPREMLRKTVRVIDPDGKPVAGAKVIPWAIRTTRGSHGTWMSKGLGDSEPPTLVTDAQGKATIEFPRYAIAQEKISARELTCRVEHPDFAETAYNDVHVTKDVLGDVEDITIRQGASLEVAATFEGKPLPADRLHAMWSRKSHQDGGKSGAEGHLQLPRIPAGKEIVRLVYTPKEGPVLFSDVETLELGDGDSRELTLEMKPALALEGRLDEGVPRPVRNGRVVAEVISLGENYNTLDWRMTATINEDGTFKLAPMPPGNVQVTALCDGFMAESGGAPDFVDANQRLGSLIRAQVFTVTDASNPITLVMTPTAECLIHVAGPDGKPVAGARCSFWPNIHWWSGGSQIYCHPFVSSYESIVNPKPQDANWWENHPFSAVTDAAGTALIKNLPVRSREFAVHHGTLQLPISGPRDRYVHVELTAGEQTEVSVTLEPKGTEFLGDDE